ncbi:MAG: stage III sporulation protein AC [Clostridia bacterium]|nr:stage III sporulation protein AC [Clostridia bacterium]
MEFDIVIKIAIIGLLIAVINQVLSRLGREEYAMLTTISGIIAILLMLIPYANELFDNIRGIFDF